MTNKTLIVIYALLGAWVAMIYYFFSYSSTPVAIYPSSLEKNITSSTQISQTIKSISPIIIKSHHEKNSSLIQEHNTTIPLQGKLVIIIDDVSNSYEVEQLKTIPHLVNLSFFPPTQESPDTPLLAKNYPYSLIHLPLEAYNDPSPQDNTLHITDSQEKIESTIAHLRELFPSLSLINNHTGSRFTENMDAMTLLMQTLQTYRFTFIDSKTTPHSVASKIKPSTLSRDIFLDHITDEQEIKKQLLLADTLAQKKGVIIVIGHPRPLTIKVLRETPLTSTTISLQSLFH